MTSKALEFNSSDGSIEFEDMVFKLVNSDNADIFLSPHNTMMPSEVEFDAFNSKSDEFIGYLDFYFNGCGNYVFLDSKIGDDGNLYAKMENKSIEGRYGKWYGNQKNIILDVANHVVNSHKRNQSENPPAHKWKNIDKVMKARHSKNDRMQI